MCWSNEKNGRPGFGEMSPDVRASRRVREVIWEYDLWRDRSHRPGGFNSMWVQN
ncbi:unnamed protein product [Staurois parvus]|uniref:Uncharacterized protein n=1 Tax=Staurois parvus TaxID=386267 RepID=A0ABN9CCE8_9NEOB|nr:unnamed protein product [Staurois parvus]